MSPDIAILLFRLYMGTFFLCAAYRKTTEGVWPAFRARLGLHPAFDWFIPSAQLAGGTALILGLLTSWAALGLLIILVGAVVLDVWHPFCKANRGNTRVAWFYNACENYHFIMILGLLSLTVSGSGHWGLDAIGR